LDEFGVAFHELLARAAWDGAVATVVQGGDVAEEVGELVGDVGLGDSCISYEESSSTPNTRPSTVSRYPYRSGIEPGALHSAASTPVAAASDG
jgi:hypothetical protein